MSKITDVFTGGRKALITFVTGGDPDLETTGRLILAMRAAGADIIEIGIPFSDPIAEGPVIQSADERALSAGTTIDGLFGMVKRVRQKTGVPLLFMTYINPVYKYGISAFTEKCAEAGIDGIIIPDMPYEEEDEFLSQRTGAGMGVELISLVTPTSAARAEMIAEKAEGYLYCVSSLGVTGARTALGTEIGDIIQTVKARRDIPCAIGFGVSTPGQAAQMAAISDGVIVGSAIVRIVAQYGKGSEAPVKDYVASLRAAIDAS
ncbi:MAG: tryptophan synthase subunit alpha [Clostridiales Family XIII bacterium]|jgi:tryptophan synthase alpha chain|nr:tryptophan synthase subunit alpha [Clostridiales Family XIII bacterium]